MTEWSPYSYCYNNPLRYEDQDGAIPLETIWDIANVGIGVTSLVQNIKEGNYWAAAADAGGVLVDAAAVVVPYVPGGVSTAIKAGRAADNAIDAAKTADKVSDVAKAVNKTTDAAKTLSKNKSIGKQGEKVVTEALQKEVGEGKQVFEQVSGKLDNGGRTQFDNVIVDKKTGKVEIVNETKTGAADYSKNQSRYYEGGETATFSGKKQKKQV